MKKTLIYLAVTLLFNTAIAGVLNMLSPAYSFKINFIFSQCIGLTIALVSILTFAIMRDGIWRMAVLVLTLPISVTIGTSLACAITGLSAESPVHADKTLAVGLFFGFNALVGLFLAERVVYEVQQRKLIKSESEKREIEAHLKLLQAQIEPHFLFNTLANVSSLIDGDPLLAKKLLEHLNDWLRVALVRARSDSATLGDELDMLENYLRILKIRFGERLRWSIDVPEEARRSLFPPMLLQPLLENAVRHGIEPKLGGGEISIRASFENTSLHLIVSDSGMGLAGATSANGAGLSNVRARLAALFGETGSLTLTGNTGGGASATLTLPRKALSH